jgi:hypothetical protein
MSQMIFRSALAVAIALTYSAGSALAGANHDHSPKHGGIVAESKALDAELVAKADSMTLFLRDHGKPMSAKGAKAKLTILVGAEKSEVELLPNASTTALEAKGTFKVGKGTKVVALVSFDGNKQTSLQYVLK